MASSPKIALITGITGQDGSYLAELLLHLGYEVIGIVRPGRSADAANSSNLKDAQDLGPSLRLIEVDLLNRADLGEAIKAAAPNEIYHLASPSHVGESFSDPGKYAQWIEQATANLLELTARVCPKARFFHASSAEVFGDAKESPQTEATPFSPVSPYGVGKAAATNLVRQYRERQAFFACNGIMYNHESPRRGANFVSQKIAEGVAAIATKAASELRLGYLESRRDWGHAKDFARAIWLMLQAPAPDDYIIATGETHSVREFLTEAFAIVDLDWQKYVISDPSLRRAVDPQLVGNPAKIRNALQWRPEHGFKQLVTEMVQAAMQRAGR